MKKLILVFLLALSTAYLSCKKGDDGPDSIYGTWKLTEWFADPGDGSSNSTYQKYTGEPKYIMFQKSGKVAGDQVLGITKFKVLDNETLEAAVGNGQPFTMRYKLTADTLQLNPFCIEGCGYRYIRQRG